MIDLAIAGAAAILLMGVAAFSARVFIDGDTNWHVAAGRWILAHHTVPHDRPVLVHLRRQALDRPRVALRGADGAGLHGAAAGAGWCC